MIPFGLAIGLLLGGGFAALLARSRPRLATALGAGAAVAGSGVGLVDPIRVLAGRVPPTLELPWSVPGGSLSLGIDALSAFFLVPIFFVGGLAAVYGAAYLADDPHRGRVGAAWLWFDLLLASMALVATAANGILFLMAWEMMALASFFLVVFHHERQEVSRAGWVYLVATHLGTAFLLVLFAGLARDSGSLDFADWTRPETGTSWLFALALVGFGSKAGLFPFHVWLPEAHPVAPSHVSALLSGVMIKLGVYGILRILLVLGPPPVEISAGLVAAGLVSGGYGVVLALGQHDLKRLLAYHSVENVGIIVLGIALSGLAASEGRAEVAAVALAGGLLHVWNHALFKALLFLGAGAVGSRAGTLEIEHLGGLLRRMPWTGSTFLLGAAAICALPPLNGFVSEFLIYTASFTGVVESPSGRVLAFGAAIAGLAAIGGLAAACFAKAAGITFLGEPRSTGAARAREATWGMRAAMLGLAGACVALGIGAPIGLAATIAPVREILGPSESVSRALRGMEPVLWQVGGVGAAMALAAMVLVGIRRRLPGSRLSRLDETWGCGYASPSPRMQYTASSLAQPLTELFAPLLGGNGAGGIPRGLFAEPTAFSSRARDVAQTGFIVLFRAIARLARRVRPLQAGNTQIYVLYTVLAVLATLIWKLA